MAKRLKLSAEDFEDPQVVVEKQDEKVEIKEPEAVKVVETPPAPAPLPTQPVEVKKEVVATSENTEKPAKKLGRRPNAVPTERDFISINLAGLREGLELLCAREALIEKRKISYNEYIIRVLKEHLEDNKQIIEAMKATALM